MWSFVFCIQGILDQKVIIKYKFAGFHSCCHCSNEGHLLNFYTMCAQFVPMLMYCLHLHFDRIWFRCMKGMCWRQCVCYSSSSPFCTCYWPTFTKEFYHIINTFSSIQSLHHPNEANSGNRKMNAVCSSEVA